MIRNAVYRYLLGRLKPNHQPNMLKNQGNKFTVSIEGNIGSGKSSLLGFFRQFPYVEAVEEPINRWTHVGGKHNALRLLYEDPARWSFAFNHYSTLTRLQIQAKPCKSPVKMIERSLFSTRYTFVENAHKVRWLTDLEFIILNEYFDYIESSFKDAKIDLYVYLRVSPEICLERIRKRSRKEENPISMEYIQTLHTLHEDLFVRKNRKLPAPVLVLDGNADLSDMYKIYDKNKLTILGGYT